MASSADATKRLLHDQITAMQHKIQLLEDDRTAHYECSQSTMLKNRETIRQLRQENEALRSNVAEANSCHENIIEAAFENRGAEKHAYRNMSVEAALTTLDQNVLSKMKRLNALKHTNDTYKCRLEALKAEYQRETPEGSSGAQSADARTLKTKEDARNLRALENRLEKTEFKWKEAENIMIHYERVKSYLQEESLTFPGQLDSMEAEILKQREELHNMQLMKNNAQLVKESAKVNLQQQEELLYKERKERERILANYRKKVEECKIRAEKANRRVQRTIIQPDELSSEAQRSTPRMAGEEEKAISTFEEAFRHIKEATGVTDIQEIMKPFLSQRETRQHLDKLKGENEKVVQQLHEQKELLNQQFQDMKYSGEANLSSEQQMLEEREQQLQAQQQRCDASKECLERLVKTLGTVRAGVEHLADKLQHIELSEDTVAVVSPDSDEYVLELMTQCELKLQLLHKEHQGKDVAAIRKEMEEEEEESLTFPGQLDSMEAEILKQREELHNMQLMKNNAQLVKESAKVNLQQQEELLYKERKERERILANYRKKVEECKIRAEKANRRVQRTIIQPDELSSEAQRSTPRMAGEEEKAISTFEEAFRHIKEATGVTDIQEIMKPFLSQRETRQHLDKLKGENEKVVQQLHEQKELLNQQFQDMKYSGEANLSSEQQMLEEREQQLQAQQQRCDASKECLERLVKTLGTVRAGVEHLADKLQHIELSEDTVAVVSPDSDEYVLELMTQCELKLQLLHKEHQGKDVAAIRKEMEEEEFYIRIERKLPSYNTRVKLPEDQILDHFNDEDDSEGDEADILTREALKRQSQMIIDSKSKKKAWKKKGKL